jgi:hypothetical protein
MFMLPCVPSRTSLRNKISTGMDAQPLVPINSRSVNHNPAKKAVMRSAEQRLSNTASCKNARSLFIAENASGAPV